MADINWTWWREGGDGGVQHLVHYRVLKEDTSCSLLMAAMATPPMCHHTAHTINGADFMVKQYTQ